MTPLGGARVLIAGAGYVGTRLGERLVSLGAEVFALRRRTSALPSTFNPVAADLLDAEQLARLPSSLDFVVYAVSPDSHDDAGYEGAYCRGLANLLEARALESAKATRILFTSSTAVYGQTDGSWVDEASETEPTSFSGRRLLEAERILRESGRSHVVLRLAGIYGPGRDRLIRQARAGQARYPAQPVFTNRIHREDCAGALVHLMTLPEPDSLYVGVDHEPAELATVQRFICEATQSPPPRLAHDSQRARGGNKRCSSLALRHSGYHFAYPSFREGYADLIASSGT